VAAERKRRAPAKAVAKRRATRSRRRLRLVWAVALVGVAVYLYYRPLASYVETRGDLTARQAEVAALEATRAGLERRLVASTSLEAAQREARRMGWVRPNERLYVVKGIPDWRKARSGSRARDGEKP
jgi:cell division septal protein FtsQ